MDTEYPDTAPILYKDSKTVTIGSNSYPCIIQVSNGKLSTLRIPNVPTSLVEKLQGLHHDIPDFPLSCELIFQAKDEPSFSLNYSINLSGMLQPNGTLHFPSMKDSSLLRVKEFKAVFTGNHYNSRIERIVAVPITSDYDCRMDIWFYDSPMPGYCSSYKEYVKWISKIPGIVSVRQGQLQQIVFHDFPREKIRLFRLFFPLGAEEEIPEKVTLIVEGKKHPHESFGLHKHNSLYHCISESGKVLYEAGEGGGEEKKEIDVKVYHADNGAIEGGYFESIVAVEVIPPNDYVL